MEENKILALIKMAQDGDIDAKQELLLEFYHPVEQIAKGMDRYSEDLIGEGMLGLERSIMEFNFSTKVFRNYARYRVRKYMFNFLSRRDVIIDKPQGYIADHQWYIRCRDQFFNTYGREPGSTELQSILGRGNKKFTMFMQMTDQPLIDNDELQMDESIAQIIDMNHKLSFIRDFILNSGTGDEKLVLTLRMKGHSFHTIGAYIGGVTAQRAEQIIKNAFRKIRRLYHEGDKY